MLNENRLRNATLRTWTLQVYKDFKLGIAQTPHEAALARSMQNHKEWWPDWEAFDRGSGDSTTTSRLIHIHHDARVLSQVEQSEPKEIRTFYDALREKGFTEFETVHTIALGLTEEFAHTREHNEDFKCVALHRTCCGSHQGVLVPAQHDPNCGCKGLLILDGFALSFSCAAAHVRTPYAGTSRWRKIESE